MKTVDYIVIGAGSAGCAVAGRLAGAGRRVLLIEAGGSDRRLLLRAPLGYGGAVGGRSDWAFETQPEPGCDNRRIPQPRGKVLGGTSSLNAMVWVRGTRADYDGWRLPGWSWEDVEPVFRRIESHYLDGPTHGTAGPMHVSRLPEPDEVSQRFVAAARAAGVSGNEDIGGPDLDGVSISPVNIWRGRRWSSARGYIDPVRRRANLTVLTGALVHRVVIRDGAAIAVEYQRYGRRHVVAARCEIVLSAGAFGTPQLLQLSGIGPAEHLRRIGVSPLLDSPHVGTNLTDHPATFTNWELTPQFVGLADVANPKWLLQWIFNRSGKMTSNAMEAVAHIRSHPGLDAPDFQLICAPVYAFGMGTGRYPKPAFSVLQSYWTPRSRGTVLAQDTDPTTPPAIRFNALTVEDDVTAFVRAIRRTREIVATDPLAVAAATEINPGPAVDTDEQLRQWIRSSVATTAHPAGTAAMGPASDSVLDERLRVRGIAGLRVADASVFPCIPRANTNAPAIMIGERCADFMLGTGTAP